METERKLDVLADIARALNQSGVTWAVGGSLLLYFKGKTGVFRDIDLMVCETDVEKLKQAMLPLGAPAPSNPNAQYRTRCFLEFTIRGVDVDVMAGFVILENEMCIRDRSTVTMPTRRPSASTTGSDRKPYRCSSRTASSWSVPVATEMTPSSITSLTSWLSRASSRLRTVTTPSSLRRGPTT